MCRSFTHGNTAANQHAFGHADQHPSRHTNLHTRSNSSHPCANSYGYASEAEANSH